jgi:excisionase family DNA binding protein
LNNDNMTTETNTLTGEMLNAEAAARFLGYHTEHLRRIIRKGVIKALRFGNSLAISRQELERYQRERMR